MNDFKHMFTDSKNLMMMLFYISIPIFSSTLLFYALELDDLGLQSIGQLVHQSVCTSLQVLTLHVKFDPYKVQCIHVSWVKKFQMTSTLTIFN